ncbi:hypothetical protein Lfu02_46620 [Longispora fulva]|uniref:Uncharacterized protein n=1 Tax=Longispora fulva TaxID=619741 RepID=A0A8J7GJP1_9ACTN|nr:hypothetical protein [Longispora fulva]MBG6138037.1 hypothetical protein [Longispora fulva]GIG60290.1 hypothetical protein Lfu02_46620 [Longispora fulva]
MAIGLVTFAPDEETVAVSPSGDHEVVVVDAGGRRAFVLRTRDGVLSRQAAHPLFCFSSSGGDFVRFIDDHTVEVQSLPDSEPASRVSFVGLDVPPSGCD